MSTENDAEIARILAEDYELELSSLGCNPRKRSKSYSPIPLKNKRVEQQVNIDGCACARNDEKNENYFQTEEDNEIAYILQIEEIVLSENRINTKTDKMTNAQLEKTHADMTKALQPTEQNDFMNRIVGMFITIQNRYANCQAKNQALIDQVQKLAVLLYPMLIAFQTKGKSSISKAAVSSLALGLITNVLQGSVGMNDAKEILVNMFQLWNDSNVWYEFFEQLVYILVAVTVPSFAQEALEKIKGKISSSN